MSKSGPDRTVPIVLIGTIAIVGALALRAILSQRGLETFALSGKPAPAVELSTIDGGTFSLAAQRGKVVVLDFWAVWCGPCQRALPKLESLHQQMKDQPVTMVGVNLDDQSQYKTMREVVAKHKLTYPVALDKTGDIAMAYQVESIPYLVVIDPAGNVVGRHVGFSAGLDAELGAVIRKLLSESAQK